MDENKIERLAQLRKEVAALHEEVAVEATTRMNQIEESIKALWAEGIALADTASIVFDLSDLDLPYGAGGLHYLPENAKQDRWGDTLNAYDERGWRSSGSSC